MPLRTGFCRPRRAAAVSLLATLFLAMIALPAQAQEPTPSRGTTAADLIFDGRARIADGQHASDALNGGFFSLQSDALLGPHRSVAVDAIYQYRAYRLQRATVGADFTFTRQGATADAVAETTPFRLEAGILRIPFGIYDYEETYTSGLISYPLPRLDYAYDSVDWGVAGAKATTSRGPFQLEAAAFGGSGQGTWGNYNHVDGAAVRVQAYLPTSTILGVSYWDGHQSPAPGVYPAASVKLGGIDLRYTRSHLLVRGEAIAGISAGDATRGGYLDAYYRLPGIEAVTLVGRAEALKPATALPAAEQVTLGVRWVITPDWTLSGNWQRNNIAHAYAFTWTQPTRKNGAVLFQLLRRIPIW